MTRFERMAWSESGCGERETNQVNRQPSVNKKGTVPFCCFLCWVRYESPLVELNDEQKKAVGEWAEAGANLNEIQKRLKDEFGITQTYLETRFMVADLGISLVDRREPEPDTDTEVESEAGFGQASDSGAGSAVLADGAAGAGADGYSAPGGGSVKVATDSIAIPGTVVSGSVTFSDGKAAKWYLDQLGRLGFDPDEPGYRPSEADSIAFQNELEAELRRQGL